MLWPAVTVQVLPLLAMRTSKVLSAVVAAGTLPKYSRCRVDMGHFLATKSMKPAGPHVDVRAGQRFLQHSIQIEPSLGVEVQPNALSELR
jgi:hypothetical protein